MKYAIETVAQLKSDIINAFEIGVVLDKTALDSFEAFDKAVDDYIDICREMDALNPAALPSGHDVYDWYVELTGNELDNTEPTLADLSIWDNE